MTRSSGSSAVGTGCMMLFMLPFLLVGLITAALAVHRAVALAKGLEFRENRRLLHADRMARVDLRRLLEPGQLSSWPGSGAGRMAAEQSCDLPCLAISGYWCRPSDLGSAGHLPL